MFTESDSYYDQELWDSPGPSLPLISRSDSRNRLLPHKGHRPSLDCPPVTGFDWDLFLLLINGLITVCWGIALIIFQTGHIPISWNLTYYGQLHRGITNVIVTGVATISTSHLKFTVQNTVREYVALLMHQGFTLRRLKWMQEFARGGIRPPFELWRDWRHTVGWPLWLLVYGLMAVHSASLVAILQPQSRWGIMYNDPMPVPCGVDANTLTLNPNLTVLPDLEKAAEQIGMQFGNYYEQVAFNTTTIFASLSFVKDNFGYGALVNGTNNVLQEVLGVQIVAECATSSDKQKLAALWSAAFPGKVLPAPTITNGSGTFGALPESTSQQAVITSSPTFNLTGTQGALYAIVNASGGGGVLTIGATGDMTGCTWTAIPRLVHLQRFDWTFATIGSDNATTVPLLTGSAVYAAVQGMAQAVRLLGASLSWEPQMFDFGFYVVPNTAVMLQTLLADALKGTLSAYNAYTMPMLIKSTPTGVNRCYSDYRKLWPYWYFGNEYNLGWVAIGMSIGFGGLALFVVWHLRTRARIKGLDALEVVDAYKLGVHTVDVEVKDDRVLYLRNGRVLSTPTVF